MIRSRPAAGKPGCSRTNGPPFCVCVTATLKNLSNAKQSASLPSVTIWGVNSFPKEWRRYIIGQEEIDIGKRDDDGPVDMYNTIIISA